MWLSMPELCWEEPVIPCDDHMKLSKWVDQVSTKRNICWSKPRRNYRVEAILTNTLYKAKSELKRKWSWSASPYYRKEERKKQAQAKQEDADVGEEKENLYNIRLVPGNKAEENTGEETMKWDDEFVKDVEDVISNLNNFMNESYRLRWLRRLMKEQGGLPKWIIRREMLL